MRVKWSNKVDIVVGFIDMNRLKAAQDEARELLSMDREHEMLLPQEIHFLKSVVRAKGIDDVEF
tara:strand:- start:120 stop:311 length:192 start_codon:yes stop_codon:yes gene_type:complete